MPSAPAHGAVVRLLLIDQCRSGLRMTREALAGHWGEGVETVACADVAAAAQVLRTTPIDVVLADCETLAVAGGLEAGFSRLAALAGGALILALSDGTSVSVAVEAMRSGAHDTLVRPVSGAMLACRLEELGRRHGKARAISPVAAAPRPSDFEGFVGNSAQMCEIYDQIVRVDVEGQIVTARMPLERGRFEIGERVWLVPDWRRRHLFDAMGRRLPDAKAH